MKSRRIILVADATILIVLAAKRFAAPLLGIGLAGLLLGFPFSPATHSYSQTACSFSISTPVLPPHGSFSVTVANTTPGLEYAIMYDSSDFYTIWTSDGSTKTATVNVDQIFGPSDPRSANGTFLVIAGQHLIFEGIHIIVSECNPSAGNTVTIDPTLVLLDSDSDGIADGSDVCPLVAEDRDGIEDGDGCPEYDDRKIIFIQGIDSFSGDCGQAFWPRVGWIRASVLNEVPTLDSPDDFFYFSYSNHDGTGYCRGTNGQPDYQRPQYDRGDTCSGIEEAALKLFKLVAALIEKYPDSKFDIMAHSMGGMVAAFYLQDAGEPWLSRVEFSRYFRQPAKRHTEV